MQHADLSDGDAWYHVEAKGRSGPVDVSELSAFAEMGLPRSVLEWLAEAGIVRPTPIQELTIPEALLGRDVIGRAQTGSGKTLAFGLPMLARLAGGARVPRSARSLILVPTRELAMQVTDSLVPLAKGLGLRVTLVAGGMSYTPQIAALSRGVDVLVATPGRLNDLLSRQALTLDAIEIAVLDEADHMAELGFMDEITDVLDGLPEGQRLLFSATLDRGIDGVVARYLHDPVTHSTDEATAAVATMRHERFHIDPNDKRALTAELANRPGKTLVFARTQLGAERIASQLRDAGILAGALHGGLTQGVRNRVLGAFRDGRMPVVVATDVAARGIHVDDISLVLQVDPPKDHKDYLHRSGRTARAGDQGTVVTLVLPHQRSVMKKLFDAAGVAVEARTVAPGDRVIEELGGGPTSGIPVDEGSYRAVVEPPRRRVPRGTPPRSGQRGVQRRVR